MRVKELRTDVSPGGPSAYETNGDWRPFSILRMSDMKVVYHEHCGKMDDPEYTEDMVSRVNNYNQAGIMQGDKLTFSFETTAVPLDVRVIDRLINEYFK